MPYGSPFKAALIYPCILQLLALQQKLRSQQKTKNAKTETEDMEGEEEGEDGEGSGDPQDVGEVSFDLEPAARPSEEEIRQEMLSMFHGGASVQYDDESTVFAITMMCMADGYEAQVGIKAANITIQPAAFSNSSIPL